MIDEQKQPETISQTSETNTEQDSTVATEEDLTPATATEMPAEEMPTNDDPQSSEETNSDLEDTSNLLAENEEIFDALQQENANLKKLLDEKTQQVDISKAQYTRLAADFDNFRRRTAQEKANLELQAKKNVIVELLPVIDNFERARTQLKPETEGEKAIHNSYQGVYKTLVECLKRMGVSAMRPEGQQFDPNFHEAMLREATNEHPEGTVLEQLMRGYVLGDLILRHAMVKVAVPIEPVITSEEEMTEELEQAENIES